MPSTYRLALDANANGSQKLGTSRHPSGITANLRLCSLGRRYGVEGDQVALLHGYALAHFFLRYRWRPFEVALGSRT
jgi:hypothetical protein